MTPESIIKSCKHCLGGACTACISSALDEARVAAVTAYASGNAHVCQNGKLKLIPEMGCGAGCESRPRRSLRETHLVTDARIEGWAKAKADVFTALMDDPRAWEVVEAIEIPEEWSRLYETERGEITG